jgi:hypothetical protein
MTAPRITQEAAAALFVQRHHGHLPIDCPAMETASDTLRRGTRSPPPN